MSRQRRLRKLVPDPQLIARRAAGEPLRALAGDYGVSHTTLGRFLARPDVAKEVKQLAQSPGDQPAGPGQHRLRKLVPDSQLVARRAAGEPWRALAGDYGVSHTTLVRFFARPEVAKQLRQAAQQLRAERRAEARRAREFKREVLRRAKEQEASNRLTLSRADLPSRGGDNAASAVAAGGGIEDVIEATGLRTHDNVLRLIDPAILKQALRNDAARAASGRSIN